MHFIIQQETTQVDTAQAAVLLPLQNPNDQLSCDRKMTKSKQRTSYVDVTPYLIFPQVSEEFNFANLERIKQLRELEFQVPLLGNSFCIIEFSIFSKRWKEATMNRKWPYSKTQ